MGYCEVKVPESRIVILEGIYALNEKLRELEDLTVSITGLSGCSLALYRSLFQAEFTLIWLREC